jgi:hypothetical protein
MGEWIGRLGGGRQVVEERREQQPERRHLECSQKLRLGSSQGQ